MNGGKCDFQDSDSWCQNDSDTENMDEGGILKNVFLITGPVGVCLNCIWSNCDVTFLSTCTYEIHSYSTALNWDDHEIMFNVRIHV